MLRSLKPTLGTCYMRFMSFALLALSMGLLWGQGDLRAQCRVQFVGVPCVGNSLTFSHNGGAGSSQWNFNGEGSSNQAVAAFVFNTPGMKKVSIELTTGAGVCRDTIDIEVFPLPQIRSRLVSLDSQCITNNSFCFIDSSVIGGCVTAIRYLFDDGELQTRNNPTGVQTLCKTIGGNQDRSVGYTIEVVSCNGCVNVQRGPRNLVVTAPRPVSFTSNTPNGCDTVTAVYTNTSTLPFADVRKFLWNFGDGTLDSTRWGTTGLSHFYSTRGPQNDAFTVKLTVWQKGGCIQEFEMPNAAINTQSPTGIKPIDSLFCDQSLITPEPEGPIPPGMSFTWRLTGGPGSPLVFNEFSPAIRLQRIGPQRLVLETSHPSCLPKQFSDTFFVIGPRVKIEELDSGVLIPQEIKYQCRSLDTVHFPNRSRYYFNDALPFNDDSTVVIAGGRRHWVFGSDLYPLAPANYQRKDDHIFRIWDFDDPYAPSCTTNTALGLNIGRNCRYSADPSPSHYFTPWDTIYKNFFFLTNQSFVYLDYTVDGDCNIRDVDTTEPELHRTLFYRRIPKCYDVTLTEEDTLSPIPCKGVDRVSIVIGEPDISLLDVTGQGCLTSSGTNILLRASFIKTKPGCSFNSIQFNPNVNKEPPLWKTFVSDPPDNAYEFIGFFDPTIVYSYDSSVFSNREDTLKVGFIVGNGVGSNQCKDTLIIANPFKVKRAQSEAELLYPANASSICVGDSIVFSGKKQSPVFAEEANTLVWNIRKFSDDGTTSAILGTITERRVRTQPHPHPDSSHLFVEYLDITDNRGLHLGQAPTQKRIMLAELFDYDIVPEVTPDGRAILFQRWLALGLPAIEFTEQKAFTLFWNGKGTIGIPSSGSKGCLDTTGLTELITFTAVAKAGGKRSLHHRDTSVLPIDTVFAKNQSYTHAYAFAPPKNGLYEIEWMVMNDNSCFAISKKQVVVGFSAKVQFEDTVICSGSEIQMKPVFRYFKAENNKVVIDTIDWWDLRKSNAGNPGFEGITQIDWSKEDDDTAFSGSIFSTPPYGMKGHQKTYLLGEGSDLYYNNPGIYTLRVVAIDSNACKDTITQRIYVLDNRANFSLNIKDLNCRTIIEFFDSSSVSDVYDTLYGRAAHFINKWKVEWGDGETNIFEPNLPPQVGHRYAGFGDFKVKLTTFTKGLISTKDPVCVDTFTYLLQIPGPQPKYEPMTPLVICLGDSVSFANRSNNATGEAQYIWNFGDSTFKTSQGNDTVFHTYSKSGSYQVYLIQSDSLPGTIHYCAAVYPDTSYMPPIEVVVLDFYQSDMTQDKEQICIGDTVLFTTRWSNLAKGYRWIVERDSFSVETTDTFFRYGFSNSGDFKVEVTPILDSMFLGTQCNLLNSLWVYVDSIRADFEIDSGGLPKVCFVNTSINAFRSDWGFYHRTDIRQTGQPFLFSKTENQSSFCIDLPDSTGDFVVCLITQSPVGCLDTLCKPIRYMAQQKLFVPNVFTPGKDGLNDLFQVIIEGHDYFDLQIFNRWGIEVFRSQDHEYMWNGMVNNTGALCPDATYFYLLRYRFEKEKDIKQTNGTITLIREEK